MRYLVLILGILALPLRGYSESSHWPGVKVPKDAKTRDELVKVFGTSIGNGPVQRAEFSMSGRQIFAVWYCPFSGRAACYLHAYYFDPAETKWELLLDRLVDKTHNLSAELNGQLIFRDVHGAVVLTQSLAKVPAEKWDEKK